jgi:hypothetical protein
MRHIIIYNRLSIIISQDENSPGFGPGRKKAGPFLTGLKIFLKSVDMTLRLLAVAKGCYF